MLSLRGRFGTWNQKRDAVHAGPAMSRPGQLNGLHCASPSWMMRCSDCNPAQITEAPPHLQLGSQRVAVVALPQPALVKGDGASALQLLAVHQPAWQ